ncbi:hypothetical protein LINPERPRIM_LOCUS23201 [Linum perenne]
MVAGSCLCRSTRPLALGFSLRGSISLARLTCNSNSLLATLLAPSLLITQGKQRATILPMVRPDPRLPYILRHMAPTPHRTIGPLEEV